MVGLIIVLLLAMPWETENFSWITIHSESFIWLAMFVLLSITVASKNTTTIDQASMILLGSIYIGFGFHYMIATRIHEIGLFWTILIFVCIWASDSGAYFVGSKLGKHPLWPQISPKKSIEGAIGGVVISIIVAICFSIYRSDLLSLGQAILLGFVIAVVGQFGDLIQSAYKRVKGIKDTGTLLPARRRLRSCGQLVDRVSFPSFHWTYSLLIV